jgi:hypothetical protein
MKRFVGWVLAGAGAVGTLWGAYYMLSGSSNARMDPLPVTAMTGGLIGLAMLTVGLVWARD